MKFKLLLFLLFITSQLMMAQTPYRNLIFSEVRMDQAHHAYVELCNMGDQTINLGEFEFGNISPWSDPYIPGNNQSIRLPNVELPKGKTFVVAIVRDWGDEQALIDPEAGGSNTKKDTWRLADMKLHAPESPGGADPTDSITPGYGVLDIWGGTYCYYIRHHYMEGDSIVTDAVNGVFTGADGRRPGNYGPSDVAGVPDATVNSILVRKFSVKTGNLDWEQARGVDITDSEWLPIPIMNAGGWEMGRKEYWTVGNHGNFRLDAQSLTSSTVNIDWDNKVLNCGWGTRNSDSIMNAFNFAPGVAWQYVMSANKLDSAYTSVRTGDSITLFACGNQLDRIKFGIKLLPPTNKEARVIPKNANNGGGWFTPYVVSENIPGMDTISEVGFDTRVDSLLKYLEKPDAASWNIIFVDGVERPDLKNGDKLKVTSADGTVNKEYFIKVEPYIPNHNGNLSSITWPDIPEFYKGIFGWVGDTIPNFSPTKYNYTVQVPWDAEGIPALVARPENPDTKIEVERATSLFGSDAAKTVKFHTTAEDDTSLFTYSIRLEKEKDLSNVQPYSPDPFFSQFVFRADWRQFFIEICNPGNQALDLSRYVIVRSNSVDPANAITRMSTEADWAYRFQRYVPGYVWVDEASWQVQPSMLQVDYGVNPIVEPGDVFVLAWAFPKYKDVSTRDYPGFDQIDVNFKNGYNPWGIELEEDAGGLAGNGSVCGGWFNDDWILYKILNDSVLDGTKPLISPYDVEVIDIIGRANGSSPGLIDGVDFNQNSGLKRYPQYYKGNPEPGASFGDGTTGSEWLYTNSAYWESRGYGWPLNNSMNSDGIGSHEFINITEFISTVSSASYTVSSGYGMSETIGGGVQIGITISEFMNNIISVEGQTLTFTYNGTVLSTNDVIQNGTTLVVVSPNGENTTRYTITATADGLDDNARLTSSKYTITINGASGTVSGIAPGTSLREVYNNVTAPANAALFGAFKADGSYAAFVELKLDTTYNEVVATDQHYFEVIAQDGETRIEYQLQLTSSASDAYVLSTIYDVNQTTALISLIPDGSNVNALMSNLIPAPGASMKINNKMDQPRVLGTVYEDDKLIVTAQDGTTSKTYTFELFSDYAARYLARLYSEDWVVNQTTLKITGPVPSTSVDEFLSYLWASLGATFKLVDETGNEVSSGNMDDGFKVIVTSENGKVNRTYDVIIDRTNVAEFDHSKLKAYPNPTTGFIQVDGVSEGNTINVYNNYGNLVLTRQAASNREALSLEGQAAGMYLITVNNNKQRVAQFKLMKK